MQAKNTYKKAPPVGIKAYLKRRWYFLIPLVILPGLFTYLCGNNKLEAYYHSYTIWSLIYGVISSSLDYFSTYQRNKYDKKLEKAEEFSRRYDDEHLRKARELTRILRDEVENIPPSLLLKKIQNNEELKASVIHTFNFWERIELAIEYDTADEEYLKTFFAEVYIDQYNRFKVWLDNVNKNINPTGQKTLQRLFHRWNKSE